MSAPLSFKVCLLDGDMILRRHQDHLRQHPEAIVIEPFGSSGEDPIAETVPSLLPHYNPRYNCIKSLLRCNRLKDMQYMGICLHHVETVVRDQSFFTDFAFVCSEDRY